MKLPWKFERMKDYEERAKLLGQKLAAHEGYFRDNDGSWIIQDSEGNRVASVVFQGQAKRGEKWNAPDPEGQATAELIVKAVNAYTKSLTSDLPRKSKNSKKPNESAVSVEKGSKDG